MRTAFADEGSDGQLIGYSVHKLGAHGSDLAAISWFFDTPFAAPVAGLTAADRAWVLGEASFAFARAGAVARGVAGDAREP